MDIPSHTLGLVLEVLGLEGNSGLIGVRNDKKIETEGESGYEGCGDHIRDHHPVETDTAGEDGNDFRISRHLRSEEYHRYEYEQRAEHIHEVRDKVHIIVKDDGFERGFLSHKVIDSFTDIEDDHDTDNEEQRNEERADEFPHYVKVYLPWSEVKLHVDYNLVVILRTVSSFQALKSPAFMCLRASRTRSR